MAATPKPVRKMAKAIKKEHKVTREKAVTSYGKAKGHAEIKEEKNKPLSSLKHAAEFRLKNRMK